MLKQLGFWQEREGGSSIVEPLLHGENSTISSFSGYDIIDITPQTGISAAEYSWKQVAGSVSISGEEEFKNSGSRTRIINLLDAKIRQLEMSMKLDLNEQLFSDGSGNGGKDITGLQAAVENGAAWSTYGGIDSNSYTFWRNQWADEGGALAIASMRDIFNSCSRSGSKPKLIVTTQNGFQAYETLARADNTINTNLKLGDAGFTNLEFKGVPLTFDEDCPTQKMYFLNPEFMKFVVGKGRNFVNSPFMKPVDQEARVAQLIVYCQLVLNNRARQGVLDGITDAA